MKGNTMKSSSSDTDKGVQTDKGTRISRIRQRILDAPQQVCVERARYITRSMKQHWEKHPLTRMSLALEAILNQISVIIREDERIVGCRTSKLKGAPLFPENKTRWIEGDVDNFDRRQVQRALITKGEKEELKQEILPFWKGKTVEEAFEQRLFPDVEADMDKYIFTFMLEITYGIGHFTMDHEKVLSKGLGGIIQEAWEKLDRLSSTDKAGEKGLFYEAVIRSLSATIGFAERYADLADHMAATETNGDRSRELQEIAKICRNVPRHPARTFHEALQSMYFIHLVSQIETGGNSVSLGRVDQFLYPFYKADMEAGILTRETAKELISLVFLKTNEIWNVLEEAYIPGGEGTEGKTTQNVTVGGLLENGADGTNDLSHIVLEAYAGIRTVQPNFSVRLSPKSPELFFQKAIAYCKDGVLLHLFNDEIIVKTLVNAGHTLGDARNYGVVGCLEPNAQGKSFGSTFAVQFNVAKCLEFALSNGIDNIFGYVSGLETGEAAQFVTFDQVFAAYDRQVTHYVGQMVRGITCLDQAIADVLPSPFCSAMIEGPMDKGTDLTKGGAIYNSTGVQFMGFSNTTDSLFAIKTAVFEDKKFTMEELFIWLAEDWTDAQDKQAYLVNQIPKYGNDHEGADAMAIRVADHLCGVLSCHKNYRNGRFWPGIFSVGFHITMGAFTGATPDGRNAGDVLGNGISPSNGVTLSGPTAVLNSVAKLPLDKIFNGANLNMRFQGNILNPELFSALVTTYFQKGGAQVQFNMVDSQTLLDARKHPEQYRDLIVRISGYSAIFVNLSDIAQDEIIARTQFNL